MFNAYHEPESWDKNGFRKRDTFMFYGGILALALFMTYVTIGFYVLDPRNIAWLSNSDPFQHYLGWLFFRYAEWSFPLGLSPSYGLELSNSIVYGDSNTLLALLFKPFSSFLPEPFQYFGIWLFMCFVLQAVFAAKIIRLFSSNPLVLLFGITLLLCSPPMIWRIHVHMNLCGHFLLLAGIYFNLSPKTKLFWIQWTILLCISVLVHFYLFVMVSVLWCSDVWAKQVSRTALATTALKFCICTLCVLATAGIAGYFLVDLTGIAREGGFGIYRFNPAALFDPKGWSHLWQGMEYAGRETDSFLYLGLGFIFLLVMALGHVRFLTRSLKKFIVRYAPFFVALVLLTLFAASHHMGIGGFSFTIPIPMSVERWANILRASGRFFWPVFYVVAIFILYVVVNSYRTRTSVLLLGIAAIMQVADTSAGWLETRSRMTRPPSSTWPVFSLTDPFWETTAARYKTIRLLMPENYPPGWQDIGLFAGNHRMGTDMAYLSRINSKKLVALKQRASALLETCAFDPDTLYILDINSLRRLLYTKTRNEDLVAHINGRNVLVPNALPSEIERYAATIHKKTSISCLATMKPYSLENQEQDKKLWALAGLSRKTGEYGARDRMRNCFS